jgi:Flp pilus assembly protein CpaB
LEGRVNRRTQSLLGLLSLLLAGVTGAGVYLFFGRFATTTTVPVPKVAVPAGALLSPSLLVEREAPRALLDEPIYTQIEELVGQVAQVPLSPGMVVYRHHAVDPRAYRMVEDPELIVTSLPVDPARAVGGQVQPGHRVDVWRLPVTRGRTLSTEGGERVPVTATLVLSDVLVVDVRAAQGQAVARRPQAVPGQLSGSEAQQEATTQSSPLQILTVALPVTQTQVLFDLLAGEENNEARVWVALAPLVRVAPPPAPPSAAIASAATPTLAPSPTPTATATPLPPLYRVVGTGGTLRVREAPRGAVVGDLPEGATVFVDECTTGEETGGTPWCHVAPGTTDLKPGWVSGAYLEEVAP